MKVEERHSKLIEIVRKKERVSVEALAASLETSRETIRRDLGELEKIGKIQKIHGGAIMPRTYGEGSFQERMSKNVDAKVRIARAAADLIHPHETLFLNSGSTMFYFAEELSRKSNLTIATNSTEIARVVSSGQSSNKTFLLGGEYYPDNRQTLGAMVTSQIATFRAHHCVLAVRAIDCRTGLMEFRPEEAQLAAAMIDQAQSLTLLADETKFDALASFMVCPLTRITNLVCDKPPPRDIADRIASGGGKTIVAIP